MDDTPFWRRTDMGRRAQGRAGPSVCVCVCARAGGRARERGAKSLLRIMINSPVSFGELGLASESKRTKLDEKASMRR